MRNGSMNIIHGIENFKPLKNPVVTVGSFDGVHLAHKALLEVLNREAEAMGGESLLITFEPHPRLVLPASDGYAEKFQLLTPYEEKINLLEKTGLQNVLFLKFDADFAAMPYQRFIEEFLVGTVGVRKMIVGFNHNFGHDREGSFESVKEAASRLGFEAEQFPEQLWHEQHFSSTKIRALLAEGRLEEANTLLGYEYRVYGFFTESTTGFPARFETDDPNKLIPAPGAYLVRVRNEPKYDFTLCMVEDGRLVFPDIQPKPSHHRVKVNFIKRVQL